jgi:Protein of unknown function (DUF2867)
MRSVRVPHASDVRVPHDEFLALDLEVHELLKGVPLRDVSAIDLPGGEDRTIADVVRIMERGRQRPPASVLVLVAIRRFVGRAFRWDERKDELRYASRLTDDQCRRSLAPVGTQAGAVRILYQFPYELLGELENATVHAFSSLALQRRPGGWRLYWAVYVESVSRFTPLYMAAIDPFRRFVVYPALLKALRAAWVAPVG